MLNSAYNPALWRTQEALHLTGFHCTSHCTTVGNTGRSVCVRGGTSTSPTNCWYHTDPLLGHNTHYGRRVDWPVIQPVRMPSRPISTTANYFVRSLTWGRPG